ncbi:MAG: DNA alkylation repair protein [Candidatus Portnoybacteria bacterium RBG_13_41_18]|uniref:DNA alkylation repair protein n=1 Tax=Candidatus Portnoybacteria bacterium RBG_13_41_18 TaxID=1801991 RepID=A0A1G2F646_9BACT|nr:MAG: DNA alkylation repair protein [Candidatus Portnoybacteria bacterium RBG_13_41_18]
MQYSEIVKKLKSLSNPKNVAGMARFGIGGENMLGISIPNLRALARKIGKNKKLAKQLWDSKIHEARILAGMVDEAQNVTAKEMDRWVRDFDSWDVCDQVCMNLFRYTKNAPKKCFEWAGQKDEFVKRAGFALMAALAFAKNDMSDAEFKKFLPVIKRESTDERNYVRKAVNWALRQIGKRNKVLNKEAIKVAREILKIESKSARWIAGDALRELTGEAAQKRLN